MADCAAEELPLVWMMTRTEVLAVLPPELLPSELPPEVPVEVLLEESLTALCSSGESLLGVLTCPSVNPCP
jgi:hypothetical protein